MKRSLAILLLFILACPAAFTQSENLPECEWCGATEAPANISWQTTIPNKDESGQWIIIKGRVFHHDGKTSAQGVILYVYHTNAKGIYQKKGNETGNGKRHGYLRGWLKTNAKGEYQFTTIKPASYPNRSEPAHIHLTVKEPNKAEYWLDSYLFEGDPLLTQQRRSKLENRGGSGIITLKQNEMGLLEGYRNIRLMQ